MTQDDYRNLVRDLCDIEEGLSDWEMDFIDAMYVREGNFTDKQKRVLNRIYRKVKKA